MQDTKEIKVGQLVYDPVDKRLGHITEISTVVNKYDDPEGYQEVMYDVEWQDNEYQYEMTIPYYAEDIRDYMDALVEYMNDGDNNKK